MPRCFDMQLQSERLNDFQDRGEAGVAVSGQSFVKAFSAKSGIVRKLSHAARTGYVSKRFGDKSGIIASLFQAGFEVKCYVFLSFEVFDAIPAPQFDFIHWLFLNFARQFKRCFYIPLLCRFVSTGQQQKYFHVGLFVIHTISGANMNAHFGYAFSNRAAIAKIAIFRPVDSRLNPRFGYSIPQFIEPFIENLCGLNRIHRQDCIPIYTENKSLVSMTESSNWNLSCENH